jgi:hypothetical protein
MYISLKKNLITPMLSEWGNKMRCSGIYLSVSSQSYYKKKKKKLHFCFKLHVKNIHGNHSAGFSSIFRVTNPIRHKGAQKQKLNNPTFFTQLYSIQARFSFVNFSDFTNFFFLLKFSLLSFSTSSIYIL